uniref:RxLR effector protein n=1 Tax=Globisporangium ultimum (strain ATCC 200006 / CBS 805.95 / DAOM BR144) TaxID=431595 RepID=K3WFE6_GLOUD
MRFVHVALAAAVLLLQSTDTILVLGSQEKADYNFAKMERQSSQDMPIMASTSAVSEQSSTFGNSYMVSNNAYNNTAASNNYTSTANNNNNTNNNNAAPPSPPPAPAPRFASEPEQESPPFVKSHVQLSRPSMSNLDGSMEFNHSFAESYAESYSESYSDVGYMNSFVQGMPGSEGLSVGAESAMGDALAGHNNSHNDNTQSHWMDEMRDTGDSYAMLESYGSERGSAVSSRFSTDSEYTSRNTQQL